MESMEILVKQRKELNLSQMAMAKKLGVSLVTIQLWERGVTTPKKENQEKVEQVIKEHQELLDAKNTKA